MSKPKISSDGRTITVRVQISTKKRGGRKLVLTPEGSIGRANSALPLTASNPLRRTK
jgi:hypothetical protein